MEHGRQLLGDFSGHYGSESVLELRVNSAAWRLQ